MKFIISGFYYYILQLLWVCRLVYEAIVPEENNRDQQPTIADVVQYREEEESNDKDDNEPQGDVLIGEDRKVVEHDCVFCGKLRKQVHGKRDKISVSQTQAFKDKIKANAKEINDNKMIEYVNGLNDDDPIFFHVTCRTAYYKSHTLAPTKASYGEWHVSREIYARVYYEIFLLVSEEVIKNRGLILLPYLVNCARTLLETEYKSAFGTFDQILTAYKLESKLVAQFGSEIKIFTVAKEKLKIIASADRIEIANEQVTQFVKSERILELSLQIRKEIYSIEKKSLPKDISATDVINGECLTIPPGLYQLVQGIICGSDPRSVKSENLKRKVKSVCYDLIYNATHGGIKPWKHLCLGVALKSMTSSRNVVDLLNKFGHCSSYHIVEQLETEATYASTNRSVICPDDIELLIECFTGVSFDNFDRFTETSSGKDTLHDTVGIIYQNVFDNNNYEIRELLSNDIYQLMLEFYPDFDSDCDNLAVNLNNSDTIDLEPVISPLMKRRRFEGVDTPIDDYIGKPKIQAYLLPVDDELRTVNDTSYKFARMLDKCWVISRFYEVPRTPMWVGFNSLVVIDDTIKQRVSYLTPINESPTQRRVVAATLKMSEQIARECKQPEIQVSYDLAIAKVAYQIQADEKFKSILLTQITPKYQKLFIHLGAFHIQCAYFKATGTFIDDCGLTHVMVESELLASGSVSGFLSGKHFNRCKKLHPIAALAIQILHFESFIKLYDVQISDQLMILIVSLKSKKIDKNFFANTAHAELNDLINQYEQYVEETLDGKYGVTPKFYLMYVEYINNYQTFSRSIRMGDFDMYKIMINKLADLFFVFNQVNYCRWILWYLDQLLKVSQTHPYVAYQLRKGFFGIKRTDKSFSRMPIDLTLEQTYNADAGRRLTGINCFTNSISARQKWSKSHCFRSTLTTHVHTEAGLKKKQDTTADLEPHNIIKSTARVKKLVDTIKRNYMNPFDPEIDKTLLYNISTGRPASAEIANFLSNVNVLGTNLKNEFIKKCSESPDRFEKAIKLNKILNFVSGNKKQTVKVTDKEKSIKMQRDLFGRILVISLKHEPNLPKIITFPLTPLPNCFCHLDGSIYSTAKSALLHRIVGPDDSSTITNYTCDVMIIDGFFYLYTLRETDITYAKISTSILKKLVAMKAHKIHLVFDQYLSPSIKDYERNKRGISSDRQYLITRDMRLKSALSTELRETNFKKAFVQFLIRHWQQAEMAVFFERKTVFINYDECHEFKQETGNDGLQSVKHSINALFTAPRHEEADTRIVHTVCNLDESGKVIVKCDDTDIFIILLGNMHKLKFELEISLLFGVSDNMRFIDVTRMYAELGEKLCKALPAFHAFTGCDYNPSFYKKAKIRPYSLLYKSESFQVAFGNMTDESMDRKNVFSEIEKFICCMYSQPKSIITVDSARHAMFIKKFEFKSTDECFAKLNAKNIDSTMMPPCQRELYQQFLRSHYIAAVWGNVEKKIPTELKPDECGWKKENSTYDFCWFEGEQWPARITDIIIEKVAESNDEISKGADEETNKSNVQDEETDNECNDAESDTDDSECDVESEADDADD